MTQHCLCSELAAGAAALIHVARDDKRAEAMAQALAFAAPEVTVLRFPAWDCLPFDRVSPNPDISAARMATLAALAHGVPGLRGADNARGGHAIRACAARRGRGVVPGHGRPPAG